MLQRTDHQAIPSFANILKSNSQSQHVVVIKPKDTTQVNKKTFEEIKSQISPSDKGINKVRNATNGGIIVECASSNAVDCLKQDALKKLGDNYTVTIPEKKLPKLRVFGMSDRLQPGEIGNRLRSQNPELINDLSHIDVVVVFGSTNSNRYGFKLNTDPSTFAKILEAGKLRIGWDLCSASESVDFPRCYNSSDYYHLAKQCTSKPKCPKCSGEHSLPNAIP